jgi:uncharacterized membrane protein HdeD (DUF308 family)
MWKLIKWTFAIIGGLAAIYFLKNSVNVLPYLFYAWVGFFSISTLDLFFAWSSNAVKTLTPAYFHLISASGLIVLVIRIAIKVYRL